MSAVTLPLNTPLTREFIHGAVEVEQTQSGLLPHRLPAVARVRCHDAQLAMAESQPSGVRLMFQTLASAIELTVLATKRVYAGMPSRPDGVYDLLVDGRLSQQARVHGGRVMKIDMAAGSTIVEPAGPQTLRFEALPPVDKMIEIWLPHDETTEVIALRSDAPVIPVPSLGKLKWVHHGSSISQGSNATSPTGIWPAVAAARSGVDLQNLGFGGSAVLDHFVASTIRNLPADIISVKIGINIVNMDLMRLRAFEPAVHGFIDTIRDGHPKTPLIVISPIFCPIHEKVPGPTQFNMDALAEGRLMFRAAGSAEEAGEGKLTLTIIREQLETIVGERAKDDANLRYLDGRSLYGPSDNLRHALPDELHPDSATHQLIGERFASLCFSSKSTRSL